MRCVVVPSPSPPELLVPQQYARLSTVTPQVWLPSKPEVTWRNDSAVVALVDKAAGSVGALASSGPAIFWSRQETPLSAVPANQRVIVAPRADIVRVDRLILPSYKKYQPPVHDFSHRVTAGRQARVKCRE
jgi:hypothetical protein